MNQVGRAVARRTGVTQYHQVYSLLLRAIAKGEIRSGAALPTESELMEMYKVSRNTVRRAIDRLVSERRVVRRRGSGTYVLASDRRIEGWQRLAQLSHDLDRFARATSCKTLKYARVDTPVHILQQVPDFSARSLLIERTRYFERTCFAACISHIPEAVGAKLTRSKIADKLIVTALKQLGFKPATGTRTIEAVGADASTAQLLNVAVGAPILMTESLILDASGQPLEFQRAFFLADIYPVRCDFRFEGAGKGLRCQPVVRAAG